MILGEMKMSIAFTAHHVIAFANGAPALVSGASCMAGVIKPTLGLPKGAPITSGVDFYVRAYAVRALPLSVVALAMLATGSWAGLAAMLIVMGLAQVGDSVLGALQRNRGMTICAGVFAIVHLLSAVWIVRH
jgi:hypothetical protein